MESKIISPERESVASQSEVLDYESSPLESIAESCAKVPVLTRKFVKVNSLVILNIRLGKYGPVLKHYITQRTEKISEWLFSAFMF